MMARIRKSSTEQHMMCLSMMDRIAKTSIKAELLLYSLCIIISLQILSSHEAYVVDAWTALPPQYRHKLQLYTTTTRLFDRTKLHRQLNYLPNPQPEEIPAQRQREIESKTSAAASELESSPQHKLSQHKLDNLRILLIDNHDSYTYNLYQYLSTMTTHPVRVVMNDAFATLDDFIDSLDESDSGSNGDKNNLLQQHFDCIVLSPGPGQPSHPSDMGIVLDTIRYSPQIPILGVCLGHQALGYVYGNQVTLAPCGPVHGLMSSVYYTSNQHNESGDADADDEREQLSCQLFQGIKQNFNVVRYHSLVVDFPNDASSNESEIEPIAWCKGLVGNEEEYPSEICMALRHKQHPHVGVQFHPESIGTGEAGYQIIRNFCDFAYQYKLNNKSEGVTEGESNEAEPSLSAVQLRTNDVIASKTSHHRIYIHKLRQSSSSTHPEEVFEELFSSSENSFWLDSSTGKTQLDNNEDNEGCPIISNSRFSIMGSDEGPLSRKIEYFGIEHPQEKRGLRVTSNSGTLETIDTDILSYLRQTLIEDGGFSDDVQMVSFRETEGVSVDQTLRTATDNELPFDYRGGYVGFLGYELRHITQCSLFELGGGRGCTINGVDDASRERTNPNVPTAAFFFADRSLLFDHHTGDWYLVGVATSSEEVIDDMLQWMQAMEAKIAAIGELSSSTWSPSRTSNSKSANNDAIEFVPNRPKEQYQMDIARSHEEIRNGESYELCVTNQLESVITLPKRPDKEIHESPFDLYKILRSNNPAPFSAFMNFYNKEHASADVSASLSICCSSPERFLSVKQDLRHQNFVVESKPIKGTIARYIGVDGESESSDMVNTINDRIIQQLRESTKDQAENLMIVDLLRNDLGRVCEVGSVHVPYLMNIESYATVHQMVSTVRGNLDGKASNAIDVIEACFPGGSMTGAPKQRTMEILHEIEEGVSRGPYSGCLGYISLNGCMDMNIIIRSAVLTPISNTDDNMESWKASIGCGGAITALSDSNDEYEEMLLKSRIVRHSISQWAAQQSSST
jgi:para-aminobenzoate synthetase